LVVEINGGLWLGARGGHTSGKGHENDCLKHNTAVILGWVIFNFTPEMVKDGRALKWALTAWQMRGQGQLPFPNIAGDHPAKSLLAN
jgi:hypothetical protein